MNNIPKDVKKSPEKQRKVRQDLEKNRKHDDFSYSDLMVKEEGLLDRKPDLLGEVRSKVLV